MGDSGISSPPPFGAPPSLALSPRPPIAEEDSGVEGEQQPEKKIPLGGFALLPGVVPGAVPGLVPPNGVVPVKKRDTMIRELKSKLRERFRQNGDSDDDNLGDSSSGDDCSAKNTVSGGGKSIVESRRESIGPQGRKGAVQWWREFGHRHEISRRRGALWQAGRQAGRQLLIDLQSRH